MASEVSCRRCTTSSTERVGMETSKRVAERRGRKNEQRRNSSVGLGHKGKRVFFFFFFFLSDVA